MIEVTNLKKIYPTKERDFIALKDVSLKLGMLRDFFPKELFGHN